MNQMHRLQRYFYVTIEKIIQINGKIIRVERLKFLLAVSSELN